MQYQTTLLRPSPPHRGRRLPLFRALVTVLGPACALALPGCRDDAGSTVGPEPERPLTAVSIATLSFRQLSAGGTHTCGVTSDNHAYCWGFNGFGQLGDGTTVEHDVPIAVAGGLRFLLVNAGDNHSCGVTTDNRAYCWGSNESGQLGDGTTSARSLPVAVAGGRHFARVRPGYRHTCGVDPFNVAFCWGSNLTGQLGDGTKTDRLVPVRVAGGLRFINVVAGGRHSCGVTTGHRAYCWGKNDNGELGDSTLHIRLRPAAVAGGLSFRQVIAGVGRPFLDGHSCGVTTDDRAFCWGDNRLGRLGDGTTTRRLVPTAVKGGLRFSGVSLGGRHTCGATTAGLGYCWGANENGQLGNGTATSRNTPVAVSGGLQFIFNGVSAGGGGIHTCGLSRSSQAYCWGSNFAGQLGDGTITDRLTPVPVAGPT